MSSIRAELQAMTQANLEDVPRLALRPAQAADALGISRSELDKLTREGRIPHVRLAGRLVIFPVAVLVKFLVEQAQATQPAGEAADNGEGRPC